MDLPRGTLHGKQEPQRRFIPLSYFASFYNGYQWFADINPVWGQSIDIVYRHTPFKGPYQGEPLLRERHPLFSRHPIRTTACFYKGLREPEPPRLPLRQPDPFRPRLRLRVLKDTGKGGRQLHLPALQPGLEPGARAPLQALLRQSFRRLRCGNEGRTSVTIAPPAWSSVSEFTCSQSKCPLFWEHGDITGLTSMINIFGRTALISYSASGLTCSVC